MNKKQDNTERLISLMKQASSLSERASGRTTRMIDEYIQELYNHQGEWIEITDHWPTHRASDNILRKIIQRMELEHKTDKFEIRRIPSLRMKLISCARDSVDDELRVIHKEIKLIKL